MPCTRRSSRSAASCRKASSCSRSTTSRTSSTIRSRACATPSIIGLVLASLIMVLFLRDWGTSLVAGLVIPATLAVTFIVLRAARRELQPDDARRPGRRRRPRHRRCDRRRREHRDASRHRADRAARRSAARSQEIRVPLIGSTITPIVVFLPLISITGVTGTFFRALARHGRHGAADLAGAGAHLDADAQPLLHPRSPQRRARPAA